LGDRVDLVLDGGPCAVGIESTVLDLTTSIPLIRRPGAVTRDQIESVIGPIDISMQVLPTAAPSPSPGQQEKHYAPRTVAYRFEKSQRDRIPATGVALLTISPTQTLEQQVSRATLPDHPDIYAKHFYAILRLLDGLEMASIYIEMPPDEPQWLAVRDRIVRATKPLAD
jgi:L-threonylcarbamoyladenylate synthase